MQPKSFKTSFRTCAIFPLKDLTAKNASLPTGGRGVAIIEAPDETTPFLECKELSLTAGFVRVGAVPMLALEIHSHPRSLYCLLDASDEATWKMLKGWRRSGNAYFYFTSEALSELVAVRIDAAFAAEHEARCRSLVTAQERRPGSAANAAFIDAAIGAAAMGTMEKTYAHYHSDVAGEAQVDVAAAFRHDSYEASCLQVRQALQCGWNIAAGMLRLHH